MDRNDTFPGTSPHARTSMLADDIADRIALAGHPAEIDDLVKEVWGHHFAGTLTEDEAELPGASDRDPTKATNSRFRRTTSLRTKASAIARQAGLDRAAPPPRRIRSTAATPGRPIHMGRDRRDAHRR